MEGNEIGLRASLIWNASRLALWANDSKVPFVKAVRLADVIATETKLPDGHRKRFVGAFKKGIRR